MAFSPRAAAVLAHAARLRDLLSSELVIIHVGLAGDSERLRMGEMIVQAGLAHKPVKVLWESGDPARAILECCKREDLDLLIAGALKKERLVQFYLGTVARKLLRKDSCSVLVMVNPDENPAPFKNIVINAENSPYVREALYAGCMLAFLDRAGVIHVVRELKMMGLTLSGASDYGEEEYQKARTHLIEEETRAVKKMMEGMPGKDLKVNVKVLSGKSGFELNKFSSRIDADLLVTGAPERKLLLLDRVFPHDLEYVFADLPCSLLVVKPKHHEL